MANEEYHKNIQPGDAFGLGYVAGQVLSGSLQDSNLSELTPVMLRLAGEHGVERMTKILRKFLAYRTQKLVQGQVVSFSTRNPEIDVEKAIQDEIAASTADIIHYGMVIREEENPGSEFKKYTIMTSDGKHQIIPAGSLRPVTADNLSEEFLSGVFGTRRVWPINGIIIMEVLSGDLQVSIDPSKTANPSRK